MKKENIPERKTLQAQSYPSANITFLNPYLLQAMHEQRFFAGKLWCRFKI